MQILQNIEVDMWGRVWMILVETLMCNFSGLFDEWTV